MTPSSRKNKGKKFEEIIASMIHEKLISNNPEYWHIYNNLENERLKPKRDTSSGTFTGSLGDIDLGIAKKFFPYTIECKHWKSLDLSVNSLLQGKLKILESIWEQALAASGKNNLIPLVVFKANRTEIFVYYDIHKVKFLPENNYLRKDQWIIGLWSDFINKTIGKD